MHVCRQEKVAERYYWKGMASDIANYCSTCLVCQRQNKMPKKTSELHPVGVPNHAFAQWGMDLVGPLSGANECFLMVLTEYLTKWAEVYPIPNKQATTVFKCLKKVIGRFGVPETIISDQGREFCNELNDNFCKSFGISRRICTAYHPQSNGLTERFNQTICGCLSKFSDGGKLNWEDDLDLILLGYRSSIQSSTLYSPFELVYGVKARLPIELDLPMHTYQGDEGIEAMEKVVQNLKIVSEKRIDAHKNIKLAQATQKRQYDRRCSQNVCFKVGDEVWYANSRRDTRKGDKLSMKRLGPVCISKACGKNTYLLTGLKRRYHSDQLEHVKRAKAVSNETQNLKSEVAECQNVTQSGTKVVIHNAQESGQEAKHEKKLSVVGIKGQVIKNEPLNKHVELQVGDEVMYTLASRNISKLDKKYGPAVISKVCEDDRYYLSGLKRKYHLNQLEKVNISIPSSKKVCHFDHSMQCMYSIEHV